MQDYLTKDGIFEIWWIVLLLELVAIQHSDGVGINRCFVSARQKKEEGPQTG